DAGDSQAGAVGLAPAPGPPLARRHGTGDVRLERRDVRLGPLADEAGVASGVLHHEGGRAQAVDDLRQPGRPLVQDAADPPGAVAVRRDRRGAVLAGAALRVDVDVGCRRIIIHAVARPGVLERRAVRVALGIPAPVRLADRAGAEERVDDRGE